MKKLLAILLSVACAAVARAEPPLTLDDCLAEAAGNNPDLAAARESVQKATYQYKASRSDNLPQLSANAGQSRSHRETATAGEDSTSDSSSMGVSARQTLFTGGRNSAAVEQAAAAKESADIQLRITEARLTLDVRQAVADLLYAQDAITLTEAIAQRRSNNVDLIQLRYDGGKEHKGSLLYMQAVYRQALLDVAQAKRALRVALQTLARVLGSRDAEPLTVAGPLVAETPGPVPDFAALALETPDHLLSAAQVRAARAGVASARSGFYPDIAASAGASRGGEDWPPDQDEWSVGVSLSYPFFPGGRNILDVRSAKAEQRRAEASARSSGDQIVLNLQQAFAGYENAVERADVQAQYVNAAEVRADIARTQYTNGLLSFDNWDPIENDLINQQKNLLASRRDAVIAQAAWEKAQGKSRLPEP